MTSSRRVWMPVDRYFAMLEGGPTSAYRRSVEREVMAHLGRPVDVDLEAGERRSTALSVPEVRRG